MRKSALKVERVPLTALIEDAQNPRVHSEKNLHAITKSLEKFGQVEPLVVRAGTQEVVGGNGRLAAMRALGWTHALITQHELTDTQARALSVALNRSAELADWGPNLLSALDDIKLEFDLGDLGFEISDIPGPKTAQEVTQDETPEVPTKPVTTDGDLWKLGEHYLSCGDAWQLMQMVRDAEFHHVISDPPYNARVHGGQPSDKRPKNAVTFEHIEGREVELAELCLRAAKRWVLLFCAFEQLGTYSELGPSYIRGGYWRKLDAMPQFSGDRPAAGGESLAILHRKGKKRWNGGGHAAFWQHNTCRDRHGHPTQKPVPLMAELIEQFTDNGDTILDPFAGSGTTLIAAAQMGRRATLIEMNPAYCDIIIERWQQLTGGKAQWIKA